MDRTDIFERIVKLQVEIFFETETLPNLYKDTKVFLERLETEVCSHVVPTIGTDSESVVISWDKPYMKGSLSIHGDGEYSYYIKRDDRVVEGSKRIDDHFSQDFIDIVTL